MPTPFAGIRLIRQGSIALEAETVRWVPLDEPNDAAWLLAERVVADLGDNDMAIAFTIGQRAALRPWSTLVLHPEGELPLPPELPVDTLPYEADDEGIPIDADSISRQIQAWLAAPQRELRISAEQFLLESTRSGPIARLKTDLFRSRVLLDEPFASRFETLRAAGRDALQQEAAQLRDAAGLSSATQIDMLLSLRAVSDWQGMIDWIAQMPPMLAHNLLVQEQRALAMNRLGHGQEAEILLKRLIDQYGASSETNSLLGRVYKNRWDDNQDPACLDAAIEAYRTGFEADWRDAFPGINAVHLMMLRNTQDAELPVLRTLVAYAAQRRVDQRLADYWDYATLLELAIHDDNELAAERHMVSCETHAREGWEAESTAHTLARIFAVRTARGESLPAWQRTIEARLRALGTKLAAPHPVEPYGHSAPDDKTIP